MRNGKHESNAPSRFLRDIDPNLLVIEGGDGGNDYEHNRRYTGASEWGERRGQSSWRMQNSRPVASQFMADEKPKITSPRQPEHAVDPLSESFKRQISSAGGNLRRVSDALRNGGRANPVPQGGGQPSSSSAAPLHEGNVIEHQRFGVGTVVKVEGTGENMKATVDFRNTGTKQLLLKFARYTIIG